MPSEPCGAKATAPGEEARSASHQDDRPLVSSTFTPMGIAIAWHGAYRDKAVDTLVRLYDDDAVQTCNCGGQKMIAGAEGLRAYWSDRFNSGPAPDLVQVNTDPGGISLSYRTGAGVVLARILLSPQGKITHFACGPERADIAVLKGAAG